MLLTVKICSIILYQTTLVPSTTYQHHLTQTSTNTKIHYASTLIFPRSVFVSFPFSALEDAKKYFYMEIHFLSRGFSSNSVYMCMGICVHNYKGYHMDSYEGI